MAERPRQFGFTLVELLTTVSIIAILVGILIPSLNLVRTIARETRQKAQFATIELALTAFRNDDGDYPESVYPTPPGDYCGAQKLAEALVGWDLMGFHPDSAWRADGFDANNGNYTYDPLKLRDENVPGGDGILDTLTERRGPYIETTNAFRLGNSLPSVDNPVPNDGLYANPHPLAANTYVLSDAFGVRRLTIGGKPIKSGSPILYFKANTTGRTTRTIYNHEDNLRFLRMGPLTSSGKPHPTIKAHPLADPRPQNTYELFYDKYIRDPKIKEPVPPRPYKPDSYILISAGADGLYGTKDDITNFGN